MNKYNKYRIIEKRGTYIKHSCIHDQSYFGDAYIPKFIVQQLKEILEYDEEVEDMVVSDYKYKKVREFDNLGEARKYKRDLELEDGIVIE